MDAAREQLLERFRSYLETAETDAGEAEAPDLYSLLAGLSALKNEVKLESRQVKNALDQFRELFDELRRANEQLSAELAHRRRQEREQVREAERRLLLELVELRSRLDAGRGHATGYRPRWLARLGGAGDFVERLADGMGMNLRRLDESLERRDVHAIDTIGRPFDPHTMSAAEVTADPARGNNEVVADVRTGYLRGSDLLRTAEVVVNRIESEKT